MVESCASVLKLKAWRLFIYLERIKYSETVLNKKPGAVSIEVKFNHYRETFTKVYPNNLQLFNPIKSRFSFGSRAQSAKLRKKTVESRFCKEWSHAETKSGLSQTTMASKVSKASLSPVPFRDNLGVEKVKVLTFYSKKQQSKFFEDVELEFNLSIDDQKFEGKSLTLQELKNKATCQRHGSEVFLFDKQLNYCNLEVTVGLVCDGDVEGEGLSLHEVQGVYYPSEPPGSSLPLPDEWM